MINTFGQLQQVYAEVEVLTKKFPHMQQEFFKIKSIFEEKKLAPEASIMVYGVYNSGKSTLVNALIGAEVAPTADMPLTKDIHGYVWENYNILDTPGVDAPIEHEKITEAQMIKTDAVIFVVNPSGVAEEEKTLNILAKLVYKRKKVFLVFNEKNPLSKADFIYLKDTTRSRLQSILLTYKLQDVLHEIPIMRVNAASALKGKLSGQPKLVKHSGFNEFELALKSFLASLGVEDISKNLAATLIEFLNKFIGDLSLSDTDDLLNDKKNLYKSIVLQRQKMNVRIKREIDANKKDLYLQIKRSILAHRGNPNPEIENAYAQAVRNLEGIISSEIGYLYALCDDDLLSNTLGKENIKIHQDDLNLSWLPDKKINEEVESKTPFINKKNNLVAINGVLSSAAKPENLMDGFKIAKKLAPSLMKDIGQKTMEKWSMNLAGKWVPYLGAALTVISSLWDTFSEDPTNKQVAAQSEKMRNEYERFVQQIEDTARELSQQFEDSMKDIIDKEIEPLFSSKLQEVESLLDQLTEKDEEKTSALLVTQGLLKRLDAYV